MIFIGNNVYMRKNKILEYYEGTPDNAYDYDTDKMYNWQDMDTIAFGYFPTNINGSYEFLSGKTLTHMKLAEKACSKLFGKAIHHISSEYFKFVMNQCYDKCYGIGRLWTSDKIIAFWYEPTKELLEDIVLKLNINPKEYIYLKEFNREENNETVFEHLKHCNGEDDGHEAISTPFRIDPKIKDKIERYNETEKSWQIQKEKNGWDTIAQRNAMIYQEGKERINEYFRGDPDTIDEYDDGTHKRLRSYHYDEANVISFGFFQTSLDGKKEFIFRKNASHHEISSELANKIIGKAIASDNIDEFAISYLAGKIYNTIAFAGRIFIDANVITTWCRFSSPTLERIIDLLGGLEKWHDLNYIIPEVYDENWDSDALSQAQISVVDYINKGVDGKEKRDNELLNTNIKDSLYEWLVDEIIKYNTPNSTLAAKTAKLGNMTIAQYNSLIHQENKKSKQTIKENMENKGYKKEFSNYISIMKEALSRENFDAYVAAKEMLEETIEERKHEKLLAEELNTNNFGILNHIFEERLPELFKKDKRAVRDVIKVIKEDKNLLGQFKYYNAIKNYRGKITESLGVDVVSDKLNEAASKTIDKNTVIKSNSKLRRIMKEHNITPLDFISDEEKKLYESGHNILTKKDGIGNVMTIAESVKNIRGYMDKHKNDFVKESVDPDKLIKEFKDNLKDSLTESEISFVKQITDWRSPIAEQRKEKLFNKFKNECIDKINEMLKEDTDNEELKDLNNQINEMKFNKETIVTDIAKLLEIRDILLDE
jgi:hypothetical protein